MKTTGYTLDEMIAFGFYGYTEISREVSADEYGCTVADECGCCSCGEQVVFKIVYARPRWSKSGKRMVEETETEWVCSAHAE